MFSFLSLYALRGKMMARALQPHYVAETKTLQRVARDPACSWRFTTHALSEMQNDGWAAEDVVHAVKSGRVILQEQKKDRLWRVEGRDVDGNRMEVIVAVYEMAIAIKVITTF